MLQDTNSSAIQPKVVVIRRRPNQGFGFTLRHFIAYPPEDEPSWPQEASDPYHHQVKAMETIFIKEVQTNGPAHYANLQTGDRVLMVNNTPIAGLAYSTIVSMIKQTPSVLTLHVVPKECDVLQMHYTSIAHTPETNRLATAPRPIPSPVTVGNGNAAGALIPITPAAAASATASASTSTSTTKSFSHQQQQLISYPQLSGGTSGTGGVVVGGAGGKASRSGSVTSSGSTSFRPTAVGSGEFIDMSSQGLHQHNSGRLLIRDDGGGAFLSRSQPPPNLTVLSRQQQQQHQLYHTQSAAAAAAAANSAFYAPASGVGAVDTSELMIRLRESIKQKEEFLKSPLPHTHATLHSVPAVSHTAQQHFFPPHTPPSGSPQLSMVSTTSTSAGSSVLSSIGGGGGGPRGQVRTHFKQPLSATSSSASSTRELLPANVSAIEMHQYYGSVSSSGNAAKNHIATTSGGGGVGSVGGNYISMESAMSRGSALSATTSVSAGGVRAVGVETAPSRHAAGNGSASSRPSNNNGMGDKYVKDLDYLETLQETGVTNKVFERKLVSHLAKGFDPFQPLSINTSACVEPSATAAAAAGNVVLIKKPTVLYESLQHHPLHQLQVQQLQQTQQAQTSHAPMQLSKLQQHQLQQQHQHGSVVDGVQYSRMEIHKASLATTTIDHAPSNKYTGKLPEALGSTTATTTVAVAEPKPALTDIAESNEVVVVPASSQVATTTGTSSADGSSGAAVVRRFKPMSSFDDSKPMRRISYLRATNNETDYSASDTSTTSLTGLNSSSAVGIGAPPLIEVTSKQSSLDDDDDVDDDDPTYDVVAGDERVQIQSPAELMAATAQEQLVEQQQQHLKDRASVTAEAAIVAAVTAAGVGGGAAAALSESRRESANSEIRNSVHIDDVIADINGKLETKDVATEMEVFETEMEIKSSCINGKRLSDYRSWRQVKIEIKGDILRIYPGRSCKESNMIELDIRNFKIFDESVDKKKSYMFRMQSKPTQIATLGNELNLDDVPDKLTSSGSSASTTASHMEPTHHQPHQQPTEILFKTKSMTEMKRIFGLLQWKNSLIYDDSDLQGRQLAEPQKTAAISSMPTATYCDDNVQHQHQHQQLQPEYSPLSTTSRGGDSEIISDSISPVMKTRKSSSHKNIPDKDLGSPKAKNWKDLLFRRGGGSSSHNADISPSSLASGGKTTGSIGVPLKSCPMSKNNEYVPLLVDVCTNIVETKGLGIVGIYRIPGNKAAISELSEQVNKSDFSWDRCNTDVRWEDVNVVSSLLKQYIRNLPDALLPCSFYINFIEADKKTGLERIKELKELLNTLPRYSYETLKHLIRHLSRVSKNCEVNLMEPKNLAIIFGPSIIRTPNDTLEIAVKDMKHQCRIVELLVTQYDYFFENGPLPDLADITGNTPIASTSSCASGALHTQEDQTNMLLHNVSKIERLTESSSTTRTSRFIPQLRRRTHSKRGAASSDTYSGESVLVSEIQNLNQSHNAYMSSNNKNKNKHKRKSLQSSINLNQTITKLISAPHNMHNALLKYNITSTNSNTTNNNTTTQSTPNICVAAATASTKPLKQCATASRQQQLQQPPLQQMQKQQLQQQRRRKAVPTIYDIGLTLRVQFQSLDSTKSATTAMTTSSSSTNATTASSSSGSGGSSSVTSTTQKTKKERNFLINHSGGGFVRLHHRKASLDEKDSGSCSGSGSGSGGSMSKEQQRSSVDISVLLTDDESSNSRSDTGSMSLTTITDTLDSKLRNLRSGSESNDENGSPEFRKNRRHTLGQPLHLHSENIPYADESPERHFHSCPLDAPNVLMLSRSCTATNTIASAKANESKEQRVAAVLSAYKNNKLQHSATVPINPGSTTTIVGSGSTPSTAASTPTAILTVKTTNTQGGIGANVGGTGSGGNLARNSYLGRGTRFNKQVYEQQCCSDDDSEGSTTSDPKDSLIIASPPFFLDRYNKKRRDHRLFRSASFNCRNYSSSSGRHSSSGGHHNTGGSASALTKDEKTDMNLTKKRQIQNKQNRSIKRRHTVGGPHDYVGPNGCPPANTNNCNHHHTCKVTAGAGGTTTTTTTVLRRIPIPSANGNISNNNNNINANLTQDGNNGNGGGGSGNGGGNGGNGVGGDNAGSATVAMASGAGGEHVLEVGIRIKNINRSRY
ncbi:serine-rich adhesin for platelets isoform X1 [Bactrocera dorsalis]|uniref:Serine-rich adhesin for platelets isoform X1 n=1 Tax=Bactrocera dorsalis TaxID=27457 RepID=A0ABM3JSS1_BACDO|nr:serine-rich adhesin for platelets isoform X1 [Bactrocera dorsalis]XP_049312252.1 serine-rich adhesin for platelets isoform X1 [Bactrocera dorsalis]